MPALAQLDQMSDQLEFKFVFEQQQLVIQGQQQQILALQGQLLATDSRQREMLMLSKRLLAMISRMEAQAGGSSCEDDSLLSSSEVTDASHDLPSFIDPPATALLEVLNATLSAAGSTNEERTCYSNAV